MACKIAQCISIKVALASYHLVHARDNLRTPTGDMLHPAMETIGNIQHNIELKRTHFSVPNFTRMEKNWLLHWYWKMNKDWVSVAKRHWVKTCYTHYCFTMQHRCVLQIHHFQFSFNTLCSWSSDIICIPYVGVHMPGTPKLVGLRTI